MAITTNCKPFIILGLETAAAKCVPAVAPMISLFLITLVSPKANPVTEVCPLPLCQPAPTPTFIISFLFPLAGIDDNVCGKGSLISSHNQLAQMTQYNRYLKKRAAIQENRNDEETSQQQPNSTLVNMSSARNVFAMQFNGMPDPSTTPAHIASMAAAAAAAAASNKQQSIAETSFINIEQPKSVIVEKNLPHSRGDAV